MTKRIHEQQRSLKSNQNYIETAGSNMRLYGRENNICAVHIRKQVQRQIK